MRLLKKYIINTEGFDHWNHINQTIWKAIQVISCKHYEKFNTARESRKCRICRL